MAIPVCGDLLGATLAAHHLFQSGPANGPLLATVGDQLPEFVASTQSELSLIQPFQPDNEGDGNPVSGDDDPFVLGVL
jgi:hypothetical protein